jgi:hypothetical protein
MSTTTTSPRALAAWQINSQLRVRAEWRDAMVAAYSRRNERPEKMEIETHTRVLDFHSAPRNFGGTYTAVSFGGKLPEALAEKLLREHFNGVDASLMAAARAWLARHPEAHAIRAKHWRKAATNADCRRRQMEYRSPSWFGTTLRHFGRAKSRNWCIDSTPLPLP